jgi:hypothetical protein
MCVCVFVCAYVCVIVCVCVCVCAQQINSDLGDIKQHARLFNDLLSSFGECVAYRMEGGMLMLFKMLSNKYFVVVV